MKYRHVLALALGLLLPGSLLSAAPVGAASTAPAPAAATGSPSKPAKTPLVDINTASEAELTAIPQIGPVRAKAIIAGRPYRGKDELVSKKIISQGVYEKIRDKIIAKQ